MKYSFDLIEIIRLTVLFLEIPKTYNETKNGKILEP